MPQAQAAPAFVVSVCLADVEYSIACWQRSSLEAARRLEQIFVDDYTTRRTTGSLQIWFPLKTSQSEQLRFLREVEDRAIEAAVRKMQASVDNPETPQPNFLQAPAPALSSDQGPLGQRPLGQRPLGQRPLGQGPSGQTAFAPAPAQSSDEAPSAQTSADQAQLLAQLLQRRHEDIQKWREDATVEARKGSNWSHEWATRTHLYKPGPALDALVRSPNGNSSGNL